MKTRSFPLILFEEIAFISKGKQIQIDYFDYQNNFMTLCVFVNDFKTWVIENDKLQLEEEYIDPIAHEPYYKLSFLSFKALLSQEENKPYLKVLIKEYVCKRLHLSELQECLNNRAIDKERGNGFTEGSGFYKQSA